MRMKKEIVIAIVVFLFAGCVEQLEHDGKTEKVKESYQAWDADMSMFLTDYVNTVFHFNHWLAAPESQKDSLEDTYFPKYKIRQSNESENIWLLTEYSMELFRIEMTSGRNLNTQGTHWKITAAHINSNQTSNYHSPYTSLLFSQNKISFHIESTVSGQWKVCTSSMNETSYLDLVLQKSGRSYTDIFDEELTVQGSGVLRYEAFFDNKIGRKESTALTFDITDQPLAVTQYPLHYSYSSEQFLHWLNGSLNLNASSSTGNSWDSEIKIHASNNYGYSIKITYRGITESWDFPEYPDYALD